MLVRKRRDGGIRTDSGALSEVGGLGEGGGRKQRAGVGFWWGGVVLGIMIEGGS